MSNTHKQQGFGHIGIILAVVVLAVVGFGGWYVWHKNQTKNTVGSVAIDKTVAEAIKNAKCDYNDKDLCKFFTGWKAQKYYTVDATNTTDGKSSKSLTKTEGTDKFYLKLEGDTPYELITIGDTTYTKATNGTWWKQTVPKNDQQYNPSTANDFKDPGTVADTTPDAPKITYKKIGKEKCGSLTCFKYQEVNPHDTESVTFLWFDDNDYQLRRNQTTTGGSVYDASFSYNKVSITVPSPVKELQPGQYIVPGQAEPVTTPSAADVQSLIDQYR